MSKRNSADKILSELYELHSESVVKFCLARLKENKDSAQDCAQEAFLILYKRILSGEEIINPRAYLYKTADILCKRANDEHVRNLKRRASIDEIADLPDTQREYGAEDLDYDEIKVLLISNLSEDEQRLYEMKYVKRMSLKEIGEILEISPPAATNRTSRLRAKIKELAQPVIDEYKKGG